MQSNSQTLANIYTLQRDDFNITYSTGGSRDYKDSEGDDAKTTTPKDRPAVASRIEQIIAGG